MNNGIAPKKRRNNSESLAEWFKSILHNFDFPQDMKGKTNLHLSYSETTI